MQEYEDLEDLDVVSQGDVFEWVGEHWQAPWHTFGVVVTADCDLVREKHGGWISYVPAWIAIDFLWHEWRPSTFSTLKENAFVTVAQRISNWLSQNSSSSIALSTTAVEDWLRRSGPEGMLDEMKVQNKGQRNDLLNVMKPALAYDEVLNCIHPENSALQRAYAYIKPAAATDISVLFKEVAKSWSRLPGDIFHLPSAPLEDDNDLFLQLRHIRQIRAEDLSARPDDIRAGGAKAKRIARVTAPYRYAITQNLAKVFSDIGLPENDAERRRASAERLSTKWAQL